MSKGALCQNYIGLTIELLVRNDVLLFDSRMFDEVGNPKWDYLLIRTLKKLSIKNTLCVWTFENKQPLKSKSNYKRTYDNTRKPMGTFKNDVTQIWSISNLLPHLLH